MSLHSRSIEPIPLETARVAHAAFPKGSLAMDLRDHLGGIFTDDLFAPLFSPLGQPALAPWRLALVSVLQFTEGLSDRQAANAVRARLDWKYALGLELTDPGFHYSVLCEFRERLIEGGLQQQLLDCLLATCQGQGWVKAGGTQRTDATHVLGAIRAMNRLESVGETLRAALNALAVNAPDWLVEQVSPDWFDRYSRRIEEYRLPKGDAARADYARIIGTDGANLLKAIYSPTPTAPSWLRSIPAVEILRRVWVQQFYAPDAEGQIHWRGAGDLPPAALWIHSPYDAQVRYGLKRSTTWVGYKVHLTETCDPESVHLITQVQTTPALDGDVTQVASIQEELKAKGLAPKTQLVDSGYTSAEELVTSQRERGIELLGPIRGDNGWQALGGTGYEQAAFEVDWEQHLVTCPQGKQSQQWKPGKDPCGRPTIQVKFARADCQACAARELCTRSKTTGRALSVRLRPEHEALQQARTAQQTREFKERIAARAGVEGTMSQGVRAFELRQSLYIGEAKTHLQHIWIAMAINVVRLAAWWHGEQPAQTRVSHFAALAPLVT